MTTLVQAFAAILLPSTLVLLLILCNDHELLGPLTNGRWLNASAMTATSVVLALSTMLTLTTVAPHLGITAALLVTAGLLLAGGVALGASHRRHHPPIRPDSDLTPWQKQTWSAPTLELVTRPKLAGPALTALSMVRGYILIITALLLLRLIGVMPA